MNTKYFGIFLHINYPMIVVSEADAIEIGESFKTYLLEKFESDTARLEPIWDIDPMTAIIGKDHPFKVNGYHPALLIHFSDFLKKEANSQ